MRASLGCKHHITSGLYWRNGRPFGVPLATCAGQQEELLGEKTTPFGRVLDVVGSPVGKSGSSETPSH